MPRIRYYKVMIAFTYSWSRDPRETHSSWHPRVPLKGKEEEHACCECPQSAQTFFLQMGRQEKWHYWLLARPGRSDIYQGKIAQGQKEMARLSLAQLQPSQRYQQQDFPNCREENGLN